MWLEVFRDMGLAAVGHQLEGNLPVLGRLAGELDLQVGVDRRGCGGRFGQAGSYGHHGKLCAPCHLHHVNIAVAVPGIKRLYGHRDQKIALSGVANALASRRMADTLGLMQRMRHMIGKSALFQNPLAVRCGEVGSARSTKAIRIFFLFRRSPQNLMDTDSSAAANAPAVTMATGMCAAAIP